MAIEQMMMKDKCRAPPVSCTLDQASIAMPH